MTTEDIAIRIANTNGHNLEYRLEEVSRDGYDAIVIKEPDDSINTYAFVLNFFNRDGDYADFNSFGFTVQSRPNANYDGNVMMPCLDKLFSLVNREEFRDGTWDIGARDIFDKPAIAYAHPNLQWGFHSDKGSNTGENACAEGSFFKELSGFLDEMSDQFGTECKISVWEYRNIDF